MMCAPGMPSKHRVWFTRNRPKWLLLRQFRDFSGQLDVNERYGHWRNCSQRVPDAKIEWVKYKASGFRNQKNFISAIYFHCGGLDLAP